ncbi:restriction endonuclease [Moraxella sp. ZY210820]|uniref:restriction endonuclease n=1 Tax=unclassified Moraxella TaxID=2685852 RepID=UPI0027312665|nr:restriction endonuclease [Moraxella sp. ZY210820]WLF85008.1 restriction endonuclease [Moraxella sp. ZY210820]
MDIPKILLHRTADQHVINEGYIGYGFGRINFSDYQDVKDLLAVFIKTYPKRKRSRNMVQNFFTLKAGDIVIVPVHKAIKIAIVCGEKRYVPNTRDSNNQIKVNYLRNTHGEVIKIPNKNLVSFLQTKLRIKRTNVILKGKYADEIIKIIKQIETNGFYNKKAHYQQQVNEHIVNFKHQLLKHIQQGKILIQAGGYGLEQLIAELYAIQGYKTRICSKRQLKGIADIDVIAENNDEKLLIQVKHHHGISHNKGIIQLKEYHHQSDLICRKIFITTAHNVTESAINIAYQYNIEIMIGKQLVEWIYENLPKLSQTTKENLGIFESYQLVTYS